MQQKRVNLCVTADRMKGQLDSHGGDDETENTSGGYTACG